jgi:hypothetical protein
VPAPPLPVALVELVVPLVVDALLTPPAPPLEPVVLPLAAPPPAPLLVALPAG